MEEKQLFVGYAREKINPPMGIKIPGHGFMPRLSDGIPGEPFCETGMDIKRALRGI